MSSQTEKYKLDLERLVNLGSQLQNALNRECYPKQFDEATQKALPDKKDREKFYKSIPSFKDEYQTWYSEAKALVSRLIPHRLDDLVRHYQKPRNRRNIDFENYRIEDCLQGLVVTNEWEGKKVGPEAAIPHLNQQLAIVKSIKPHFESSLFEIQQLVQADLFDSEIDAARELHNSNRGQTTVFALKWL